LCDLWFPRNEDKDGAGFKFGLHLVAPIEVIKDSRLDCGHILEPQIKTFGRRSENFSEVVASSETAG
jgi:hypothetical protein